MVSRRFTQGGGDRLLAEQVVAGDEDAEVDEHRDVRRRLLAEVQPVDGGRRAALLRFLVLLLRLGGEAPARQEGGGAGRTRGLTTEGLGGGARWGRGWANAQTDHPVTTTITANATRRAFQLVRMPASLTTAPPGRARGSQGRAPSSWPRP